MKMKNLSEFCLADLLKEKKKNLTMQADLKKPVQNWTTKLLLVLRYKSISRNFLILVDLQSPFG